MTDPRPASERVADDVLTPTERNRMLHAIGDKLPKKGNETYRNYYCTGPDDPTWTSLVARGLATVGHGPPDGSPHRYVYFHVSDAGVDLLRKYR